MMNNNNNIQETLSCGKAASCTLGGLQSESYTIEWNAGADIEWISGGFSVQKSWETGNNYECTGNQGDTICIWYKIAHTAYTVQDERVCNCWVPGSDYGDPIIIKSPNQKNSGGGFYCVVGSCRAKGDEWWDESGRAGGPFQSM